MQKEIIGKVVVYCAGGAGINAGKYFTTFRDTSPSSGFAEMQAVFIDTSVANMSDDIKETDVYLVQGLDGSGKIRAENHKEIGESIHDILLKHPPGDLNIVLSSTSGGSGSVIAPSLASELLKRDKNVVVAAITSTDSRIEIENSVKTLKSYEAIAKMRNLPVVMMSYENSIEKSRNEVNKQVQEDIVKLAALFSRKNKELDSADLKNWLNYTKVSKHEPRLVTLEFAVGLMDSGRAHILTVATLAYENMNTSIGSAVDYQCVGYVLSENEGSIKLTNATHYLVVDGLVVDIYGKLSAALEKIDEANLARKRTVKSIVDDEDQVNNNGLVL